MNRLLRKKILPLVLLLLSAGTLAAYGTNNYTLGDNATNLQRGEFLRQRTVPASISIYLASSNGSITTNTRECAWEGKEKVMRKAVTVYSPQGKPRRVIVIYYDRSGSKACEQVTFIDAKGRGTTVTQRFFGTYPYGVRKTVSTYGTSGFVTQSEFYLSNGELQVLHMTGNTMEAEVLATEMLKYVEPSSKSSGASK